MNYVVGCLQLIGKGPKMQTHVNTAIASSPFELISISHFWVTFIEKVMMTMYIYFVWCRWQVDGLHVIPGCFEGNHIKRIQEMKERQDCDHCYNSSSICHNVHLRHTNIV